MSNHRMPIVDALRREARRVWRRRRGQFVPIYNRSSTACRGAAGSCGHPISMRSRWSIRQAGGANLRVSNGGDSFNRHSTVNDDVVVHNGRVVDDCGLAEDVSNLGWR